MWTVASRVYSVMIPLLTPCCVPVKSTVWQTGSGSDSAALGSGGETLPLVTSCRDALKRSGLPVLISFRSGPGSLGPAGRTALFFTLCSLLGKSSVVAPCSCAETGLRGTHIPPGHDEAHIAYSNCGLSCIEQPPWIKISKTFSKRGI